MGARESTSRNTQETTSVVDYYKILEVSEDATPEDIKRSFRRLALIHHPDKNHTDVEEATRRFSAIQQAYEILSDEQERAWYDSHRASLVPEPDSETVLEEICKGTNLVPRSQDRGLSVKHLTSFFDPRIWTSFDDVDERSFFTIYRNLFSRLGAEESLYAEVVYPPFGLSTWTWSASPGQDTQCARNFYNVWMNFATEKGFFWMDRWNLSEAPERRMRRLMEKDNKKARDDARREYNETVRSLVKFIRKRDPRYKSYLSSQATITPSLKTQPSTYVAKQKAEEIYVEQEWQKVDTSRLHADLEWVIAEGDDSEEWECVACRKTFRSEAAWNSHERSKKHIKELEKLMKEMEQEDGELDLDGEVDMSERGSISEQDELLPKAVATPLPDSPLSDNLPTLSVEENNMRSQEAAIQSPMLDSPSKFGDTNPENPGNAKSSFVTPMTTPQLSKRDKRRARQVMKAELGVEGVNHMCNVCEESFPSRTKLFNHITEQGHASAFSESDKDSKLRKGKKKRK